MSEHKADDLDIAILSKLANDSSMSVPVLAQSIDANTSVVYSRIRRMLKNGLIEKYTVSINAAALGYGVKTFTGIKINTKKRDSIINDLFKIEGVAEIAEVTGRFDIIVTMYSTSLDGMHDTVSEEMGRIDGVLSSESFIEMMSSTKAMPYMRSTGEKS